MATLRYSPWLHIDHTKGAKILKESSNSYHALEIRHDVTPSMTLLVGRKAKSVLLRHILPYVHPDYFADSHGQAFLWHDAQKEGHILVDFELHNHSKPAPFSPTKDDVIVSRKMGCAMTSDQTYTRREMGNFLIGRGLAPICQTICYFASDLGGLRGIATLLAAQIVLPAASKLPPDCLPRVLVVVDTTARNFTPDAITGSIRDAIAQILMKQVQNRCDGEDDDSLRHRVSSFMQHHFYDIQVIGLPRSMSTVEKAFILQLRLSAMSQDSMAAKKLHGLCFQRDHFFAMIDKLLDHFVVSWSYPFSFVKASRPIDFTLKELLHHLQDLVSLLPAEIWMNHLVCPLLASAIQLANYPPGSHRETYTDHLPAIEEKLTLTGFPLANIYDELYRALYQRVLRETFVQPCLHEGFEFALKTQLDSLSHDASERPIATQHANRLTKLWPYFLQIRSYKTCLCCLHRTPEKVLSCKHALCNECVRIYGRQPLTGKYCYMLESCPLCGEGHLGQSFRQIPPTAGIRKLSLDGGGVRGIIQLIILDLFQQRLDKLHISLADVFDFVCGTSAGGLVVIGLFLMRWTTAQSIVKFEKLAESTFGRKTSLTFTRFQQLVLSYLRDGRYDSEAIEEAFGTNAKMFNPLASDVRVAVTTTTAKNPRPCLFTNYNGGVRPSTSGYDVVRASRPEEDVEISDAASCTSAAPWFFRPKTIADLGTFQDGGLQHNNPLSIADWELRFMWPTRSSPDFALSIGTGTSDSMAIGSKPGPPSPLKERFLTRLFRSFMRSLDGEKIWHDFRNNLPESVRHRYHRFNLPITGPEPAIDDVAGMHRLKEQTLNHIWTPQQVNPVMDSIYASMFYFEFESEPAPKNGSFLCTGNIFVRVHLSPEGRKELLKELLRTKSYFIVFGHPVKSVENIPRTAPLFKRRVTFELESLNDLVGITLRGITTTPTTISGLPKPAKDLLAMQRMRAPFGTIDHAVPEKALPRLPLKRKHEDTI